MQLLQEKLLLLSVQLEKKIVSRRILLLKLRKQRWLTTIAGTSLHCQSINLI